MHCLYIMCGATYLFTSHTQCGTDNLTEACAYICTESRFPFSIPVRKGFKRKYDLKRLILRIIDGKL